MKRISMLVVVLVFVVACAEIQPADEALSETSTTTVAPPLNDTSSSTPVNNICDVGRDNDNQASDD